MKMDEDLVIERKRKEGEIMREKITWRSVDPFHLTVSLAVREIGGRYGHRFGIWDYIARDWLRETDGKIASRYGEYQAKKFLEEVKVFNVKTSLRAKLGNINLSPQEREALSLIIDYMQVGKEENNERSQTRGD